MGVSRVWQGEGWEIREGRWQDSPPEVVDHVISDPPFSDHVSKHGKPRLSLVYRSSAHRENGNRIPGAVGECHGVTELSFHGVKPAEIGRPLTLVARRWTVLFCADEQKGDYKRATGDRWVRSMMWIKTNPTPQFTGDRPASFGEGIALMNQAGVAALVGLTVSHGPGTKGWNRGGHAGLYVGPSSHALGAEDARVHETQKPLWLMRALVEDFTDPGELVWDPYGGSMTTGVACLQLGRRFLGHELQARYCEVGVERLRAAEQGLTLKAARAGQLPLGL